MFRSSIASTALALVFLLSACGVRPAGDGGAGGGGSDQAFPEGYQVWAHVNAETIVREDEAVAREIYAAPAPALGPSTTLVKEEYQLVDGQKGGLSMVAVMRRTGSPSHNGWSFLAFDPKTRQRADVDVAACVGCHTLQAANDYLFTPKEELLP